MSQTRIVRSRDPVMIPRFLSILHQISTPQSTPCTIHSPSQSVLQPFSIAIISHLTTLAILKRLPDSLSSSGKKSLHLAHLPDSRTWSTWTFSQASGSALRRSAHRVIFCEWCLHVALVVMARMHILLPCRDLISRTCGRGVGAREDFVVLKDC